MTLSFSAPLNATNKSLAILSRPRNIIHSFFYFSDYPICLFVLFFQIVHVHQKTVSTYLEDIIIGTVHKTAEEQVNIKTAKEQQWLGFAVVLNGSELFRR